MLPNQPKQSPNTSHAATRSVPRRIFKYLGIALATICMLAAVWVSLIRAMNPILSHYRSQIIQTVQKRIGKPVQIYSIHASTHNLFPVIRLNQVAIYDKSGQHELLYARELEIGIDLWQSLLKRRFIPGLVSINGVQLQVTVTKQNNIKIAGLPLKPLNTKTLLLKESQTTSKPETLLLKQSQTTSKPKNLLKASPDKLKSALTALTPINEWLSYSGQIELHDLHLHIKNESDNTIWPIYVDKAILDNDGSEHHIVADLALQQTIPTRFHVIADINASSLIDKNISGKIYIKTNNILAQQWFSKLKIFNYKMTSGLLSGEVWANWEKGKLKFIQSRFDLSNLNIITSHKSTTLVNKFSGNILWEHTLDGWHIAGDDLVMRMDGNRWPESTMEIHYKKPIQDKPPHFLYRFDYLNLTDISKLLKDNPKLPTTIQNIMKRFNPQGEIRKILIRRGKHKNPNAFTASLQFENLALTPWQNIPGFSGVTGSITLDNASGKIILNTSNATFSAPKLFSHKQSLDQTQATVQWYHKPEAWQINLNNFSTYIENAKLNLNANLKIPDDQSHPPVIDLSAELTGGNASQLIKALLPTKKVSPKLVKFLNRAVKQAEHESTKIIMQGAIDGYPYDKTPGKFSTVTHFKKGILKFRPEWPAITDFNGSLEFSGRQMTMDLKEGNIGAIPLSKASASIPYIGPDKPMLLYVKMQSKMQLSQARDFINHSPLKKGLGRRFRHIDWQGKSDLDLGLYIPLERDDPVKVLGNMNFENTTFGLPEWHITLDDFSGHVNFTEDSLTSKLITANFLKQPVTLEISTEDAKKKSGFTKIKMKGNTTIKKLANAFYKPIADYAVGSAAYQVLLSLPKDSLSEMHLTLTSNLNDIAVNLPAPFTKAQGHNLDFRFDLDKFKDNRLNYRAYYGDIANVLFAFDKTGKWHGGELRFGKTPAQINESNKFTVAGNIGALPWSTWQKMIENIQNDNTTGNAALLSKLGKISINLKKLSLLGQNLRNVALNIQRETNRWVLGISSPQMAGQLFIPNNLKDPQAHAKILAQFNHLYLQKTKDDAQPFKFSPQKIPNFEMTARDAKFGDMRLGQLHLSVESTEKGINIKTFETKSKYLQLFGEGEWHVSDAGDVTSFKGTMSSDNLKKAAKYLNIPLGIDAQHARIEYALSWDGTPINPQFATLSGEANINLQNGQIEHISHDAQTKVGLGKVLNLFSLQSLPRRLSLDFSDLRAKGFSFNTMRGNIKFDHGVAHTNKIRLDGSVAKVDIKGKVALVNKTVDLNIAIQPHVTSSLPVIAAIAGGPIAGAITFAVERVVSSEVQKMTEHRYKVTGTWKQPKLKELKAES